MPFSADIEEIIQGIRPKSKYSRSQIDALIEAEAERTGIPSTVIRAVVSKESNYNPYAVSHKGARGLMQLLPETASEMGLQSGESLFTPKTNIRLGTAYLKQQYDKFGDWNRALAAYNWGPANVETKRRWPAETQNYVKVVTERAGIPTLRGPSKDLAQKIIAGIRPKPSAPKVQPEVGALIPRFEPPTFETTAAPAVSTRVPPIPEKRQPTGPSLPTKLGLSFAQAIHPILETAFFDPTKDPLGLLQRSEALAQPALKAIGAVKEKPLPRAIPEAIGRTIHGYLTEPMVKKVKEWTHPKEYWEKLKDKPFEEVVDVVGSFLPAWFAGRFGIGIAKRALVRGSAKQLAKNMQPYMEKYGIPPEVAKDFSTAYANWSYGGNPKGVSLRQLIKGYRRVKKWQPPPVKAKPGFRPKAEAPPGFGAPPQRPVPTIKGALPPAVEPKPAVKPITPTVGKAKPKSLLSLYRHKIDPQKAKLGGYPFQSFKEFGIWGTLKKGGMGVDEAADWGIQHGFIPPVPSNKNPSDWLMEKLQTEGKKAVEQAEMTDKEFIEAYNHWREVNGKLSPAEKAELGRSKTSLQGDAQAEAQKEFMEAIDKLAEEEEIEAKTQAKAVRKIMPEYREMVKAKSTEQLQRELDKLSGLLKTKYEYEPPKDFIANWDAIIYELDRRGVKIKGQTLAERVKKGRAEYTEAKKKLLQLTPEKPFPAKGKPLAQKEMFKGVAKVPTTKIGGKGIAPEKEIKGLPMFEKKPPPQPELGLKKKAKVPKTGQDWVDLITEKYKKESGIKPTKAVPQVPEVTIGEATKEGLTPVAYKPIKDFAGNWLILKDAKGNRFRAYVTEAKAKEFLKAGKLRGVKTEVETEKFRAAKAQDPNLEWEIEPYARGWEEKEATPSKYAELEMKVKKAEEMLKAGKLTKPAEKVKEPWEMTKLEFGDKKNVVLSSSDTEKTYLREAKHLKGELLALESGREGGFKVAKTAKMKKHMRERIQATREQIEITERKIEAINEHRKVIKQALSQGKTPYRGWEKDYPELAKQIKVPISKRVETAKGYEWIKRGNDWYRMTFRGGKEFEDLAKLTPQKRAYLEKNAIPESEFVSETRPSPQPIKAKLSSPFRVQETGDKLAVSDKGELLRLDVDEKPTGPPIMKLDENGEWKSRISRWRKPPKMSPQTLYAVNKALKEVNPKLAEKRLLRLAKPEAPTIPKELEGLKVGDVVNFRDKQRRARTLVIDKIVKIKGISYAKMKSASGERFTIELEKLTKTETRAGEVKTVKAGSIPKGKAVLLENGEVYRSYGQKGGLIKLQDGKKMLVRPDKELRIVGDIGDPRTLKAGGKVHPEEPTQDEIRRDVRKGIERAVGKIAPKGSIETLNKLRDHTKRAHSLFTRFYGLEEDMQQAFTRIAESGVRLKREAVKMAMETVGHLSKRERDLLMLHMDNPAYSLPKGENIQKAKAAIKALQNWSFKELSDRGYFKTGPWPDNKIEWCQEEMKREGERLAKLKTKEAKQKAQLRIAALEEEINKLQKLTYLHRRVKVKPRITKIAGALRRRRITARPSHFMGRKYDTIDDLRKTGLEPDDITVAVADIYDQTMRSMLMDDFIKLINNRSELSLPIKQLAPKDWQMIDSRIFPRGAYRKYHPAIATALEELVTVKNSHDLVRAYDAINTAMKMIGFYNPIFMPAYDVAQGWRLAGIRIFRELTRLHGNAFVDYFRGADDIVEMEKDGLFNNVMDYSPALKDMTYDALDKVHKSRKSRALKSLGKYTNPLHPLKDLYTFNNNTTWTLDRIMRIAARRAFAKTRAAQGLSPFKITDVTNDFLANYGKVPKQTRWTLNRLIFTPTYKVSMARAWKRMWENPKRYKAPLFRHYLYKLFMRFALPAAIGAWVYTKKRVKSEAGYRMVVNMGGGRQKVYAFTGPLLEETKVLHRPLKYTLRVNLAAVPHFLVEILRDDYWRNNKSLAAKINSYFKIGLPVLRELETWEKSDRTGFENFLRMFGQAYVYQRKARPEVKHGAIIKLFDALDMWVDFKTLLDIERKKKVSVEGIKWTEPKYTEPGKYTEPKYREAVGGE